MSRTELANTMNLALSIIVMLFSNDVWAVYGIVTPRDASYMGRIAHDIHLLDPKTRRSTPTNTSDPTPILTPTVSPQPPARPKSELRTGYKVGIGIAVGVLSLALLWFILETCFLRRRRQEMAMQRAVDEVERGSAEAVDKQNQERVVLESRVSIVVEDDFEPEEEERGRHGLSLPRRDY